MTLTTIGDMSRSFALQRQTGDLKAALDRLSFEVTTGRSSDVADTVKGDYLPLNSIETSLKRLDHYRAALTEAGGFVEVGQIALENVQNRALQTGANLITVSQSAQVSVVGAVAREARAGLSSIISAINSQIGGRGVFGGMTTDRPALAESDVMMSDIIATISGLTTANDIVTAVNDWFDTPGGGFETLGYTGSPDDLLPFDLGLGDTAEFGFRADDQEIRDVLKGFVLGSLPHKGASSLAAAERQSLTRQAGEALLSADKTLAQYRADLGTTEATIDSARARNAAEASTLEIARADIVNVDQYAAAGELESAQVQLEMLYAITARMSRLNLMEFLR